MPDVDLPAFGAGGGEPYGLAPVDAARTLSLHEHRPPSDAGARRRLVDVQRFRSEADATDREVVRALVGPVLDIGCGPGRILRAATTLGHIGLGVDVSAAAVRVARGHGLPVLQRSVFDRLPGAGRWGTAILLDGNIGIGGDPAALLRRCAELIRPRGGRVLVETAGDPLEDRTFESVVVDDLRRRSLPFAWAEVGAVALRDHAATAGLVARREWTAGGRGFAEYARP